MQGVTEILDQSNYSVDMISQNQKITQIGGAVTARKHQGDVY